MSTEESVFAQTIIQQRYSHIKTNGSLENWKEISHRVSKHVLSVVELPKDIRTDIEEIIYKKQFIPAGRYLFAAGRPFKQISNCLSLRAEDSREGWSDLLRKSSMALMTGAGIGVNYSSIREEGSPIIKTGGTASGPISLMKMLNEVGREVKQGGTRRSACLSILSWKHPDIHKYIKSKEWKDNIKEAKSTDFNFPATLDGTNISVQLDDDFFTAFNNTTNRLHSQANSVYWAVIENMLKTGEPGFTVDIGENKYDDLRNACSEFITDTDSECCNLGSINLARIDSLDEMKKVVELGTIFLLAGSIYGDVPYPEVKSVIEKNRKIGLGLMGLHEWLLIRNKKYGIDNDLGKYLEIYATSTEIAHKYCNKFGINSSVKTRCVAPSGTISLVAETTSGIEPLFCTAYKRRYRKGADLIEYQYVLDPTAKRLVDKGINPDFIEDAYILSENVEKRIQMQAWLQKYVDMGISSTINLPAFGTTQNNNDSVIPFGNTLIKYLPKLRGITTYPDGSRGAQPLVPVKWHTAEKHVGQVFVEGGDVCSLKGGSCNS